MPRKDVSRVGLSRAEFTEEKPCPKGEDMGAVEEAAKDRRYDNGQGEVEYKLYGVGFATSETVGVEK